MRKQRAKMERKQKGNKVNEMERNGEPKHRPT